jgi:hypothetical protein
MSADQEIFAVFVDVTRVEEVASASGSVKMIFFGGHCRGEAFNGTILDGGVDTQTFDPSGAGTLSARYMMLGADGEGASCRVFVENEAHLLPANPARPDGDAVVTRPRFRTDSPALRWLESARILGKLFIEDGRPVIRFYLE